MSWNGPNPSAPNWAGISAAEAAATVGDLYIVPDPPTIATNPSIGLEQRNEVPLPTAYKDFSVDDLNAVSINNNPNFDASNWSLYRAISNVQGTLGAFSVPLYSISDFLNLTVANNITAQAGNITAGLNVDAGVRVAAPLGSFNTVNAESVQVSVTNETAAVDIYGANLIAGNNALYVEGGTTLTGGGVVHGVTIGALQVAGADTNRIDVVPIGIDITTIATPIAISSGVACSVAAGAVLALSGGSYIQYNSDQHYFVNTTSGNDFTDIYVGNIHAADGGSAPLRINDAGRGVELSTINSMTMTTQLAGVNAWSNLTTYSIGNKVRIAGSPVATYYNAVLVNKALEPNIPIPAWVTASNYVINNVVFSGGLVYRCSANISGSITPPAPVSDPNWTNLGFTTNNITQFWTVFSPSVANITGDDVSNITIGKITAPVDFVRLAGTGLVGDTGLEGIANINALTLTTTLFPLWNVATDYANDAEASYQDGNWRSQFAGNLGNIPDATLQNWVSGDAYAVGNVRYYATNNKGYLCNTAVTLGTTTPPPSDAKWTEFQTGSNGEDVWYPFTAPVVSTITGDKLSEITIGNQSFVNANGEYLSIKNAVAGDPLDADQNAVFKSAGTLALAGDTGIQVVATTGDINVVSLVDAVSIQSIAKNIEIQANDATNGVILISGGVGVGLESDTAITLESQGNVSITAVAGTIDTLSTGATNIVSSLNDVNITSTTANITLTSDLVTTITASDTMGLTSFGNMTLTSTNGAVTITGNTAVTMTSPAVASVTSSASDVVITSTLGDVDITAANNVNITTAVGGNILVNTYYPPLRIYKNETIGSAVSRAANTAEIQVYQQTMTLKANTQYLLNMSYAGLTENVSTATPNNNWYYIYRIHQGTTPLTTSNLWGLAQQFNSTAQAGGVSVSFMTTTAGTYTGRFYIRNQNATVALTIANISATVTEVF
jgi:hypothetical protein